MINEFLVKTHRLELARTISVFGSRNFVASITAFSSSLQFRATRHMPIVRTPLLSRLSGS